MKTLLIAIIAIAFFTMNSSAITISNELIDAMIEVESHGDDSAVGDSGRAVGCLQIHKPVIDDVNQVSAVKYTYADRYDRTKSIEICRKYLTRYGNAYRRKTGKFPTNEVLARIWNGGPNGYNSASTVAYWNKVSAQL